MDNNVAVEIGRLFYSALVALFLWYLWHFLWRDYRLDAFRQDLLEIRDRLSEYTRNNGIAFDDPAFQPFRADINSLVKHRYHVSFVTLLLTRLMLGTKGELESEVSFSSQINRLNEPHRTELTNLYHQIILACARQISSTSVIAGLYLSGCVLWNHIKIHGFNLKEPVFALGSVEEIPPTMLRDIQAVGQRALEVEKAESKRRLTRPIPV